MTKCGRACLVSLRLVLEVRKFTLDESVPVRKERDIERDESALECKGRERANGPRRGSSGCIRDTSLLRPLALAGAALP